MVNAINKFMENILKQKMSLLPPERINCPPQEFSEIEQEIFALDPLFFEEVNFDKTVTAMCWRLECNEIYLDRVKAMVQEIRKLNDKAKAQCNIYFVAKQIKEKFGELRVYYRVKRDGVELDTTLLSKEENKFFECMESIIYRGTSKNWLE